MSDKGEKGDVGVSDTPVVKTVMDTKWWEETRAGDTEK